MSQAVCHSSRKREVLHMVCLVFCFMLSGYQVKQSWEIRKMQLSINVYLCYLSLAMWLIYILNKLTVYVFF